MQAIRAATIEGFNEFLQGQRAAPGRADLRLVQFDHEYELVYDAPLAEALELTEKTYEPRGTTALLDAIGRTINEVGHKLSQIEAKRPARIVFVVVTDGLENASHEFSREQIFDMISHQRSLYKREFIFLGANQDAIAEGKNMASRRTARCISGPRRPGCAAACVPRAAWLGWPAWVAR